jgi:hypothetical protein
VALLSVLWHDVLAGARMGFGLIAFFSDRQSGLVRVPSPGSKVLLNWEFTLFWADNLWVVH